MIKLPPILTDLIGVSIIVLFNNIGYVIPPLIESISPSGEYVFL